MGGAALVADRRLDPAALHPDGHLDRLRVAGPVQDGVGGGLPSPLSPGLAQTCPPSHDDARARIGLLQPAGA
jgi:hypothetical protein